MFPFCPNHGQTLNGGAREWRTAFFGLRIGIHLPNGLGATPPRPRPTPHRRSQIFFVRSGKGDDRDYDEGGNNGAHIAAWFSVGCFSLP